MEIIVKVNNNSNIMTFFSIFVPFMYFTVLDFQKNYEK